MNQPSSSAVLPDARALASRRRRQLLIWLVGLVVTAVMLGLGLWQAQTFRAQGQDAMRARMTQSAVPLESVLQVGQIPRDGYGRPVTVRGSYLPDQQLLVPVAGAPDRFRVVTAMRLADGSVLPVVRGVSSGTVAPPPPATETTQTGLLLPTEGESGEALPPGQLGSVRLQQLAQLWPDQLMPGFLSLDAAGAGAQGMPAAVVDVPSAAGQARNNGYALQWWIFAAAAIAATVKLSRDAGRGTMLISGEVVDNPGDKTLENTSPKPAAGAGTTSDNSSPDRLVTADKSAVTRENTDPDSGTADADPAGTIGH